jgi:hypothetical protein
MFPHHRFTHLLSVQFKNTEGTNHHPLFLFENSAQSAEFTIFLRVIGNVANNKFLMNSRCQFKATIAGSTFAVLDDIAALAVAKPFEHASLDILEFVS